jgi:hypothetical protein
MITLTTSNLWQAVLSVMYGCRIIEILASDPHRAYVVLDDSDGLATKAALAFRDENTTVPLLALMHARGDLIAAIEYARKGAAA